MPRKLEYHVTMAVPVTIDDEGSFTVGEPCPCDMGTPLNADTWDPETEEWCELHRIELPGDADSATIADACVAAVFPTRRNAAELMLLRQAVAYEAEAFENDTEVEGGDVVEFFAAWRALVLRAFPELRPDLEPREPDMNAASAEERRELELKRVREAGRP